LKGLSAPTPEIVAIYNVDTVKWLDPLKTEPTRNLLNYDGIDLFCKNITGETGTDVYHLKVNNKSLLINDKPSSISELQQKIPFSSVLQKRMKQHPRMAELNRSSVNTIRIGTFNTGNEIVVFNAILKLGATGKVCDNWHFGGIVVGVDINTGRLMNYGIGPVKCAHKILKHPDSDVPFEGFEIPYFTDALNLVKRLHDELYGIYTVGWDVAIGTDGPVVIEGNDNWDFRMFQSYYGGFKSYMLKMFNRG